MLRRMGKQSGESTESFGMHGPYPGYYRPTVSYKLIGFSSSCTTSHSRVNNGHIYRHDTVPCNADVYSNSNVTKSPQHATRCRRTSVARLMQYREHGHHLRSTTTTLCQPFTTTTFAKCAFRCSAPAVWNSLPKTVLNSDSVAVFKSRLKTFLFSQAFSSSSAH